MTLYLIIHPAYLFNNHCSVMGNPLFSENTGKMWVLSLISYHCFHSVDPIHFSLWFHVTPSSTQRCFNAAKDWQLPWYNANNGKRVLDPSSGSSSFTPTTLTLVGIAEYTARTDTFSQPVTVKLETGTDIDFFIGFNRAAGANSQNDEASDEVTVTTSGNNGEGYSQSYLKVMEKNVLFSCSGTWSCVVDICS